ncbi:cytochrome P450 [Ceratobasidium sp. AG-I]|nr:cytochrome P450 [Ceratobasidium sp. AG-I]
MDSTVSTVLAGGAILLVFRALYQPKHPVPLPPGPKGHFIFGSALEVRNASAFWLKFSEYNEQHGPIVTVRMLFGRSFITDDPRIVSELFEKRAANYSDRKINQMTRLVGWDHDVVFLPYGPLLKYYRTLLQKALNNRVALDYVPLQQQEVKKYMRRLMDKPSHFMEHIHLLAAGIAIRITYGYKVDSKQDPFVQTAEEAMSAFGDALTPGRWLVEMIPVLRYLPAWFPFATFKRKIAHWKQVNQAHRDRPFSYVEKQLANGVAEESFVSKLLQNEDGSAVDDQTKEHVKIIAASLYGGGSDTTVSAVQSFFLAMTLYPDVQAKAQAEIAEYFKQQSIDPKSPRMITPADRPNLPYTNAIVHELIRWHPILNLVAHFSGGEEDNNVVSEGKTYRIPARSMVLVNVWRILHNPAIYVEPERFMPERYLSENPPPEPESYAFGFGRRICPGLHIAKQSMWISVSNTLANFSITKAKDENGVEITPEERYTNDLISHPLPFKCNVTPREGYEEWLREDVNL